MASTAHRAENEPLIGPTSDPNRQLKEESIRHKIRAYEAFLALKAGYLPSTQQLEAWARYILRNSAVLDSRNRRLSAAGRQFVRDLRAWIEAVTDAACEKNGDDKIQEFLYHTSKANISAKFPGGPSAGEVAGRVATSIQPQSDVHELYSRLRLLFGLLYSSPEFRKLLSDFATIARDIVADAASNVASLASRAADKARPSEEELAHVDEAADTLPSRETGEAAAHRLESRAKTTSAKQYAQKAQEKTRTYASEARRRAQRTGDEVQEYLKQKFPKQRRDAVINRLKKVISDIQGNTEFQDTAEFLMNLLSDYANKIKDAAMEEGKKATEEAGKPKIEYDEHFKEAIRLGKDILTAFANNKSPDDMKNAFTQVIRDVNSDDELREFYGDVIDFLKRMLKEPGFATSDAADAEAHELFDRSKELLETKKDAYRPHVEELFDEVNAYITAVKTDKVNQRVADTSRRVFEDLVVVPGSEKSRRGVYASTTGPVFPGGYKLRTKVIRDLIDVLLPRLIAEIKYVPLPRIEYQDRDYDVILENVVLESDTYLLPQRLLFEAHTRADYTMDPYTGTFPASGMAAHYSGYTRVHLSKLSLCMRDASFVLRKKTGLIPFSDRGRVDVNVETTIDLVLDRATHYPPYGDDDEAEEWEDVDEDEITRGYFHVRTVKVNIDKFSYRYYDAYHTWAATLLKPLVKGAVKTVMARLLEDKIRESFEWADKEARAMFERMRVATIAAGGVGRGGGGIEGWIKAVLSRPKRAQGRNIWRRGERGGIVAGSAGKVRNVGGATAGLRAAGRNGRGGWAVTVGAEEELFPGEHGPGAVISKFAAAHKRATRRRDSGMGLGEDEETVVGEEEGWRSEVFDIHA